MRLIEQKRKNSTYVYFLAEGRRIYLGKPDEIKRERAEEALRILDSRITEYNSYREKIQRYLYGKPKIEYEKSEYKMIFFDMDGVIFRKPWYESESKKVAISTWDLLFKKIDSYDFHEKLKLYFEEGKYGTDEDNYMRWTEDAFKTLQILRLNKSTFMEVIESRVFNLGAKELFQILFDNKIKTALISGSFLKLAERAKMELKGINRIAAHCEFIFDENGKLIDKKLNKTDYSHKKEVIAKLALEEGIVDKNGNVDLERCVFVGDDVNDLKAFDAVGLAIAFNPQKTIVRRAANVTIIGGDLTEILPYIFEL